MDKAKDLSTGHNPPEIITVIVEATCGSRNSFEVRGNLPRLKNVTPAGIIYPADYGFIPCTRWQDQNFMRAMVVTEHPTHPGCVIDAVPIGILKISAGDIRTDKILCVPLNNPEYESVRDIGNLHDDYLKRIEEFFQTPNNKNIKDNNTRIIGWAGADEAKRSIIQAMKLYSIKNDV